MDAEHDAEWVPSAESIRGVIEWRRKFAHDRLTVEAYDRFLAARDKAVRKDFTDELAAQGLPPTASLAELIQHHRANAEMAATFREMTKELHDGYVRGLKAALDAAESSTEPRAAIRELIKEEL